VEENDQNKKDITEFIKSLQTDAPAKTQEAPAAAPAPSDDKKEAFPFSDDFDIDAFVSQNNAPLEKTLTSIKPLKEEPAAAASEEKPQEEVKEETQPEAFSDTAVSDEKDAFNIDFQSDNKDQSIKHLEQKIAELQLRFEDANKEKSFEAAMKEEIEDDKDDVKYVPNVKANDEFFQNISSTIENLKGSLENIVSSRLQYEEGLIRQDQSLITRLREKTGRLKAINLALNSEVKRAKNEKLESLRRSAEQTKELLSVRMQLSKVEEKARHGDFKLSRLEQQLSSINEEKLALEDEIRRVREDKLESLRKSAEQAKEVMSLRLELSKTEEKFKQEEIQSTGLKEQLKKLEEQRAALDNEIYASRSQRQAADLKASELQRKIEDLSFQVNRAQDSLKQEAQTAGSLREKILSLETELQHANNEKSAMMLKADQNIKQLEALKAEHEKQIADLKAAQVQEIEVLKNQKTQEAQAISLELSRAEDKYRQEETFVKTLKAQIESLQNDVNKLDQEKAQLKGKSTDLAREIDSIKEGHQAEIENLNKELSAAQEKFSAQENAYKNVSEQYAKLQQEKNALTEEIKKVIASKDEALEHNNKYQAEIESLKTEHNKILADLKSELAQVQSKHKEDLEQLNGIKEKFEKELLAAADNFNKEKYALKTELEGLKNVSAAQKEELTKQFETLKEASSKEREDFLRQIAELKDLSAKAASKHVAEITSLKEEYEKRAQELAALKEESSKAAEKHAAELSEIRESSLKESQKFLSQIEDLKKSSYLQQERHKVELELSSATSAQRQRMAEEELAKASAAVKESESVINSLKQQITSFSAEKAAVESEGKKIAAERYEILKNLEQKSKELEAFHQKYELEVRALKDEKDKAASLYQAKLDTVSQRLSDEESTVGELKTKISSLEQEKEALAGNIDSIRHESSINAKKVVLQTDEILSLKTQLAKAENRFLQDSVLISQLKEQFTDNEGSRNLLDTQIKQLREENASIRQDIILKEEEITALKETLSKTEEELQQEKITVKHLEEHTSKLKDVNNALDQEIKQVQAEKVEVLRKSAEQAKEILMLREQLSKAGNGIQTLDFTDGIISVRKEYEAKVEKLESELKDASAVCAKQVKDIQDLKTDNVHLKDVEAEKIQLESRCNILEAKVQSLQSELENYSGKDADSPAFTLAKAKAAALGAQISKINREKLALRSQLEQMQSVIDNLTEREKASNMALASLKEQITNNDVTIENLKKKIVILTEENKDLKASAQMSTIRQQVLEAKINEVEQENKQISTMSGITLRNDNKEKTITLRQNTLTGTNRAVRRVGNVASAANTHVSPAQTNPGITRTRTGLNQTNPGITRTGTFTKTNTGLGRTNTFSKNTTMRIAAKTEEELQKSVLDMPETQEVPEFVNTKKQEMDLSMLFGKDSKAVTKTSITSKTNKTASAHVQPGSEDQGPYDNMEFTDHSAAQFHGVPRRSAPRVNMRESEAYSDFLKKTKSVFFRIKWSLFKE